MMNILQKLQQIRLFVLDVDGVLTNGSLLLLDDGQMARSMNIKDGYALQLAVKKGYQVLVISGGSSEAVKVRLGKLGIHEVFMKAKDKRDILVQYAAKHQLRWDQVLYMGDDIPDLEVMQLAGLPCCPADAVPEIKSIAQYISPVKGGEGCVRDVIEKVMKLNQHWDTDISVTSQ